MTDREKLVELLQSGHNPVWGRWPTDWIMTRIADYLIFHGVTFAENATVGSKWILTSKKPPTKKDANAYGLVLSVAFGDVIGVNPWYVVKACPEELPLWMSLPELPKEDE